MSFDSNESGLIPDSRYLRKTFIVMMLIDFIYALKTYIPNLVHRKMSHLYTEKSKAIVPMCWEHEKIFFLFFFFLLIFLMGASSTIFIYNNLLIHPLLLLDIQS